MEWSLWSVVEGFVYQAVFKSQPLYLKLKLYLNLNSCPKSPWPVISLKPCHQAPNCLLSDGQGPSCYYRIQFSQNARCEFAVRPLCAEGSLPFPLKECFAKAYLNLQVYPFQNQIVNMPRVLSQDLLICSDLENPNSANKQ